MASPPSPHKEERAILEAIRQGKAPTIVKRQASRGTLPVDAEEMVEILVFLTHDPDPTCSGTARETLAVPLQVGSGSWVRKTRISTISSASTGSVPREAWRLTMVGALPWRMASRMARSSLCGDGGGAIACGVGGFRSRAVRVKFLRSPGLPSGGRVSPFSVSTTALALPVVRVMLPTARELRGWAGFIRPR